MQQHQFLNPQETTELLASYYSERTKLLFQLQQVEKIISELEHNPAPQPYTETISPAQKPFEQPNPFPEAQKTKQFIKNKMRTKLDNPYYPQRFLDKELAEGIEKIKRKGYKLSKWDAFILETIRDAQKLFTKADLDASLRNHAHQEELNLSEQDIYIKVSRVLNKLANRRQDLGAYKVDGQRGYYYGLMEWFEENGLPKKKYLDTIPRQPREILVD